MVVLEREPRLAPHQTSHNSGVVHAGIYYAPGSLKARLCVAGMKALYEFCAERGIAHERCGKLIVALSEDELDGLRELERRGNANGVPGLRMLGAEELREVEPHAHGVAALHSPETGIVDFSAVAAAYADDVRAAGGDVRLGAAVMGVEDHGPDVIVRVASSLQRGGSGGEERGARGGAARAARAARDRLRRRLVGPARAPLRRARGPAHPPVPRRLPAAAPGAARPRARADLPGARPEPAVPRGPPHAHDRRRGARRPHRAARRRP